MAKWTEENILPQNGRIILITGANSGLGKQSSLVLGGKGGHIIMACRNLQKGEEARQEILRQFPKADLKLMQLDLGSLQSVREFAEAIRAEYDRIDVLMNNAGLMAVPYSTTADGFETQIGVNHFGHFALTGLLLDRIKDVPESRIVTLTSTAAFYGKINFDDLQSTQKYSRYEAYLQAKLANFIFAVELHRRLKAAGAQVISNTAQPGFVMTELQHRAGHTSGNRLESLMYKWVAGPLMSHPVEKGVLPQLFAAVAPEAVGGAFYSPGRMHLQGYPKRFPGPTRAYDEAVAKRLWDVSEELTGVKYSLAEGAAV